MTCSALSLGQWAKVGWIVNPYAGVGGSAGLKGSDGENIVEEAMRRGAHLTAEARAQRAAEIAFKGCPVQVLAAPEAMGATSLRSTGCPYETIGTVGPHTTGKDTASIAREMAERGCTLIVFSGGDGTARDICDGVGSRVPVLGIPAGTKMHSGVFAKSPEAAGEFLAGLFRGEPSELQRRDVLDIDEDSFRKGRVMTSLYGALVVPVAKTFMSVGKSGNAAGSSDDVEAVARFVVDTMQPGVLYLVGTGSTMLAVTEEMGLEGTLLGVDAVLDGKLVGRDLSAREILALLDEHPKAEMLITVIGGQGNLFGRGNQQFSPEVLRRVGKEHITILATKKKLASVQGPLVIDTGDAELDQAFRGYWKVATDYGVFTLRKAE